MPEVASEVAARLQAQGRFEEAEDCRLVTPLLAGPGDPNPLLSHSPLCARRQLARQALEHDRRQMSEMRVGEFVGRDGKDGNHCGVFSQIYYQIHSQSRQQERPEVSFLSLLVAYERPSQLLRGSSLILPLTRLASRCLSLT